MKNFTSRKIFSQVLHQFCVLSGLREKIKCDKIHPYGTRPNVPFGTGGKNEKL